MPVYLPPVSAVLPFAVPTLADALSRLRQDVFDQAGGIPRWADSDLQRAVDRAVDRYSFISPFIQTTIVPAVAGSRLYTVPAAVLFGPSWWVEAVEYPTNCYPRMLRAVPGTAAAGPGCAGPAGGK